MARSLCSLAIAGVLSWMLVLSAFAASQTPVTVLHPEGVVHGFLRLSTMGGEMLADGDLEQVARGDKVTGHLLFHFKDGSVYEETVEYSQRKSFRVLSYHLVQKGPSFKHPVDMTINGTTGQVTVRYTDDDGKEKTESDRLKLPPDISNGLILTLVKNIRPNTALTAVSMVAAAPKPRLVKLMISPEGEDSFLIGNSRRKATRYVVKVEIGGLAGFLAPMIGKQPLDSRVWILAGDAPALVKLEGPLYLGGPVWRIELTSPVWPSR